MGQKSLDDFTVLHKCKDCGESLPPDRFAPSMLKNTNPQCRECKADHVRLLKKRQRYEIEMNKKILSSPPLAEERKSSKRKRKPVKKTRDEMFTELTEKRTDQLRKERKKYRKRNYVRIRAKEDAYSKTEAGITRNRKSQARRRRQLGFNPLNEYFEGSEFHHLMCDLNGNPHDGIGIYIPAKLHQSVRHNGVTGKGMDEINKLAIEWYRRSVGISP